MIGCGGAVRAPSKSRGSLEESHARCERCFDGLLGQPAHFTLPRRVALARVAQVHALFKEEGGPKANGRQACSIAKLHTRYRAATQLHTRYRVATPAMGDRRTAPRREGGVRRCRRTTSRAHQRSRHRPAEKFLTCSHAHHRGCGSLGFFFRSLSSRANRARKRSSRLRRYRDYNEAGPLLLRQRPLLSRSGRMGGRGRGKRQLASPSPAWCCVARRWR